MASPTEPCLSCGTSNRLDQDRCDGCGARVVAFADEHRRGGDRRAFAPAWMGAALVGYCLVLGIVVVALPFVLPSYDPQGLAGVLIALAVFLVGGAGIGLAAKDARVVEPAVAAALTSALILPYIAMRSDVGALATGTYVAGGVLGVLGAFFGAYLGDRAAAGRTAR